MNTAAATTPPFCSYCETAIVTWHTHNALHIVFQFLAVSGAKA